MDTNTYFYLLVTGCIVLIGCVYILYQKTKKIHDNQTQFQKHLMYQQSLIEKHNTILRNLSLGQPNVEESLPVNTLPVENLQPMMTQQQEQPVEKKENTESNKPSPMSTLLPMISSLMGMMNNMGEGEVDDNESDIESEMDEEEQEKKVEMVQEIEKELNELKNVDSVLPKEGRVEDESKTEEKIVDIEE